MLSFDLYSPVELSFGSGRMAEAGEAVARFGNKALVVLGQDSMRRLGILERLLESLRKADVNYVIFEGVGANPTTEIVDRGATFARGEKVNVVVALGGGSAIDAAKGIAVMATHKGRCWKYLRFNPDPLEPTKKTLPLVVLPTTSGTGSHITPYSVLTYKAQKVKSPLISPYIHPQVAIYDPQLVLTTPPEVTAYTGFDVFAHALEAYLSDRASVMSDLFAAEAMRLVSTWLTTAFADGKDIKAREMMAYADTLAGLSITMAGASLGHAMAHPLGAYFDMPHGQALAYVTPGTIRYLHDNGVDKIHYLSQHFALAEDLQLLPPTPRAMAGIDRLIARLKLKSPLRDWKVTEKAIGEMAQQAADRLPSILGRKAKPEDVETIANIYRQVM